MRETNEKAVAAKSMSVEEYIQYELTAEHRHEYINGQLFEMPGEKDINNEIAVYLCAYLLQRLKANGFSVYMEGVKVAIPGGQKFYYPDVFVTKEIRSEKNQYIKYEPEMIAEVISPSSRITDTVDKYIDYTTIPSLKYYLVVEPEITYATLYAKNAEGKWEATLYAALTDVIPLPLLQTALPLAEVYK